LQLPRQTQRRCYSPQTLRFESQVAVTKANPKKVLQSPNPEVESQVAVTKANPKVLPSPNPEV